MKNSKKGFAATTIIGVIVLIAAVISIILVVKMKKEENQGQLTGDITLSSRNGLTYIGGRSLEVMIDGDINLLNCSSGDEKIATCNIIGSKLVVTPQTKAGETSIFVMNSNDQRVTYNVMVKEVVLGLSNLSGKTYTNGDSLLETITGSNYGTLSCTSNDTEIATCNVSGNTLVIEPGSVVGATTIILSEDNVNKSVEYNVSVEKASSTTPTSLSLSSTSGSALVGGNILTATIKGNNYGKLSCTSSDTSVATCSISGTTLTVKPGTKAGSATITVKESKANKTATYKVTVNKQEVTTPTTLSLSSTSGTTLVGGNSLTATITGSNYGTLTCTSSDTSVATCSVSGTTLTVKPGTKAGSATITVKESKANKTATYKVTVNKQEEVTTLSLSSTSGTTSVGGNNLTATVKGSNYGTLTCTSSDTSVATCSVSGTTLTVKPGTKAGSATITVKESRTNKTATYKVTVNKQEVTNPVTTYDATATYSCPNNDYLTGTKCNGTSGSPAYVGHKYTCPEGYTLTSSNKCTKKETITNKASVNYICPDGYTPSGSGSSTICKKGEENIAATAQYYCKEGYTPNGSGSSMTCSKEATYNVNATDETYYYCNSGTLSGQYCANNYTYDATATYSCPSGYTLNNTKCTHTISATVKYTCPNGGTLSGKICTKN